MSIIVHNGRACKTARSSSAISFSLSSLHTVVIARSDDDMSTGQERECTAERRVKVKVKFSHTRYRALGPELIPVYRQSARRWHEVNHAIDLAVGCRYFLPCLRLPPMSLPVNGSTHLIPAYYSFIDPERMKGWVGLENDGTAVISPQFYH